MLQAGNFVREEILSAFIRLVAHTPELQSYTASKLYLALKADISQESLTLAATWILGEYSDIILQGGIVDDDNTIMVRLFKLGSCVPNSYTFCDRFQTRTSSISFSLLWTRLMLTI